MVRLARATLIWPVRAPPDPIEAAPAPEVSPSASATGASSASSAGASSAGASSAGASSAGASSTGSVPSPVLPSERISSAATGSVPASSASALNELCPSANANRSTNETNEASPRLVARRLCREFVLVPILHPPTGVCGSSLPYGPGPRPTAYSVVLLPEKVTPPSGGHIGRTGPSDPTGRSSPFGLSGQLN